MQVTLVSHYGLKPSELADYLRRCQTELSRLLSSAFAPYAVNQIHATVIGLEGCRRDSQIENWNARERGHCAPDVDPAQVLRFLRSSAIPAIEVRIGGYRADAEYPFLSRGQHPFVRSFSVQGGIAVAMGWPADGSNALDALRRSFNRLNVWHKWHQGSTDVDNDFFFVLGRVDRESVTDAEIVAAEVAMRQLMTQAKPVCVVFSPMTLRIVRYVDERLPLCSSRAYAIDDPELTADLLYRCYDDCAPTHRP